MTSHHGKQNNYKTHIAQYLKSYSDSGNELWSVNRILQEMIFLKKLLAKCAAETIPRSFYKKAKLNISLDQ